MGDNAASIAARDGNIVLSAPDLCGLSLAATAFTSQLGEELSNASAHVQIEGSVVLSYTTRGVDISFGFVDNTGKKDFALLMAIADAVNMSKSDLICFYPSKNSLVKHIELNCPTTHTYLAVVVKCLVSFLFAPVVFPIQACEMLSNCP